MRLDPLDHGVGQAPTGTAPENKRTDVEAVRRATGIVIAPCPCCVAEAAYHPLYDRQVRGCKIDRLFVLIGAPGSPAKGDVEDLRRLVHDVRHRELGLL